MPKLDPNVVNVTMLVYDDLKVERYGGETSIPAQVVLRMADMTYAQVEAMRAETATIQIFNNGDVEITFEPSTVTQNVLGVLMWMLTSLNNTAFAQARRFYGSQVLPVEPNFSLFSPGATLLFRAVGDSELTRAYVTGVFLAKAEKGATVPYISANIVDAV